MKIAAAGGHNLRLERFGGLSQDRSYVHESRNWQPTNAGASWMSSTSLTYFFRVSSYFISHGKAEHHSALVVLRDVAPTRRRVGHIGEDVDGFTGARLGRARG
jgi:hypothetical protein